MGFKYRYQSMWVKKGFGSFVGALVALGMCAFSISTMEEGTPRTAVYVFTGITCVVQMLWGIYYMNLPDKDYILLEDRTLSIYRGLVFPRKRISLESIQKAIAINTIIELKLKDGDEQVLYMEWLDKQDEIELKKRLKEKVNWRTADVS